MKNWDKFYNALSEDNLKAIALLRVIECTNGCIQHAFRDNNPKALPIEQTREAMRYSMAAMKSQTFTLGDEFYSFDGEVSQGLKEARELYVKAFKRGDESAMDEFFDCSIACAQTLGEHRIKQAAQTVREHLGSVFPRQTVDWGEAYLLRLLTEENG
jgi:hypothetical protein